MQKYFRPLLTHDTEGILALILIDQHSVTQMLYMSLSFNSGDIGQFIFFLSLHCGERQKDIETRVSFWCRGVGSKAVPSPCEGCERTVCPVLGRAGTLTACGSRRLCVPYLSAVFLSQLHRMMSRFGDAWKINCMSPLCIIHTTVGVKFLFKVGEGIEMLNFSSGRFEPEQTWSFGGKDMSDLIRMRNATACWWSRVPLPSAFSQAELSLFILIIRI